ncbi:MAG: flagellar basal body rod protein FlgC [Phycisphaerae bacterium]|nr:flagellar basal body rod protein FlgC [Phycisphaerae bacterium]
MEIKAKMFDAIDIAVSGLRAYGKHMEVISSNVANARTTNADGTGQPYRRLDVEFKSVEDGVGQVGIGDIFEDMSPFEKFPANPGDPRADAEGNITLPNVNMPMELINLNLASRAYQANAAMLRRYQKMVETSLELLR